MKDFEIKEKYDVYDLEALIRRLRAPGGCPWDMEQTHESIRRNMIEEACEVCEAIDERDPRHLREELGDVLMQVVFHAGIEQDAGRFTLDDAADDVVKKMVLRHPHVFGDVVAETSGEVLKNWDEIKKTEKSQNTVTDSLNSVAKTLPAMWRAEKIQKKAAKVGFDWPDISGALDKLREETEELREAVENGAGAEEELGDVLFTAVNVARFLGADPESALTRTNEKFLARFAGMEALVTAEGKKLADLPLETQEEYYQRAKAALKSGRT